MWLRNKTEENAIQEGINVRISLQDRMQLPVFYKALLRPSLV